MIIRKFWLENAAGELKPLNGEQGIFLENPYGLGIDAGAKYAGGGDGFFIESSDTGDKQIPMGGDLHFLREPYALFRSFSDWALRSEKLTLVYQPDTVAFRRRIAISRLTKTEKNTPVSLKVPVEFLPLTPWYTEDRESWTLGITGDGFRVMDEADIDEMFDEAPLDEDEFPLELDGGEGLEAETGDGTEPASADAESRVWDESTSEADCLWQRLTETDALEGYIIISPKGQAPSSMLLTFAGRAEAPAIYILGADSGKEYGRCALRASLSYGETLEYSTQPQDEFIRKRSASGEVVDLLDAADLQYNIFPQLPTSEPCRVLIASAAQMSGELTVAVQRWLRGV